MKQIASMTLLLALAAPSVQAQDWLPDPALVEAAIAEQPSVRAAMRRTDAAGAQARARAVGPHEFEVSAISQVRRIDVDNGTERYDEYEAQLGRAFRWPGKVALDRRIGEYGISASELRLDDARHEAARIFLKYWLDWLRASEQSAEAEEQFESLVRERTALARRVQLGDAAAKDLDLLDVELAQTDATRLAAQGALVDAEAAIAHDFPTLPLPERAPTVGDPEELPETPEVWVTRIVQRSHEIGALEADAMQADALAARSRADRLPDPTLALRLMNDRGGAERVVGLVFTMPVGGRHRSALATGDGASAAAMHSEAQAKRREIQREAEQAVRKVEQARRQWLAQQRALRASDGARKRTRRGWELGELSLAEWLLAERTHRQIAFAEASARADAEEARLGVLVDSHELWHAE
ncbi:TolC family protein [Novilysobacter antarcticus]|uniref:TolC family protein n=1 Tax=Novilysobacter antarcticus TaxID=2862543 RepID=UPI001C99D912|nr:TolC family protein [Lysobacter antarcticus]